MEHELFYRFGKLIYKLRWPIIVLWIVLIGCCIPIAPHVVTSFKSTGFIADNSPSAKAENYLNQQFGFNNNKLIIIYSSNKLETSNPQFMHEVKNSLVGLKNFPLQHDIIYPKNNKQQISKDKHTAYAVVLIQHEQPLSHDQLLQFKALIQTPPDMTIQIGGEPVFVESVNKQTQLDLFKADFVAGPITIITMIIIFESIVGAIVPIIVGAGCALMILTILYVLGQYFTLSIFTLNIALLLGLCLSLDYALFIISRFRYELRNGRSPLEAIAVTQATAGKAVFFSGLAVFVSLSALLLFPINILFSVGMGGISSVFVAVITANVLLPSILAILNKRINILSIKLLTPAGKWSLAILALVGD